MSSVPWARVDAYAIRAPSGDQSGSLRRVSLFGTSCSCARPPGSITAISPCCSNAIVPLGAGVHTTRLGAIFGGPAQSPPRSGRNMSPPAAPVTVYVAGRTSWPLERQKPELGENTTLFGFSSRREPISVGSSTPTIASRYDVPSTWRAQVVECVPAHLRGGVARYEPSCKTPPGCPGAGSLAGTASSPGRTGPDDASHQSYKVRSLRSLRTACA